MADQVEFLTATVAELNQTIKELREQLNKNSNNSSKPPSSDGLKKPPIKKDKSLREKSGKNQGAQPGHDGVNLSVISKPDHVECHIHHDCEACPHRDACMLAARIRETRQEIDAEVTVSVTSHELVTVKCCPLCGEEKTGSFPENKKKLVTSIGMVRYDKLNYRIWLRG